MNNYCIGILIVLGVYLMCRSTKEGFDVPKRNIPKDLQDILTSSQFGDIEMIHSKSTTKPTSAPDLYSKYKKFKKSTKAEALFAKSNFKECNDSDKYHSCNVATPKLQSIDTRYLNLPSTKLSSSNIYNQLSICPQTYATNMLKLHAKESLGQYSGYSENGYIDRTRYLKTEEGKEPLPVNPDFFLKGGGTYA